LTSSPTAATRLVALLGDPVHHSLSPTFQNAAFAAAALDAVYLALRCTNEDLPDLLRVIARSGGAGNVTVPHKQVAARAVERRTPAVDRTEACNTFWLEDGQVWGDNTDVAGFARAVETVLGEAPRGARVLLIGAGGAARAALAALTDAGAAEVVIVNRSPDRLNELAKRFEAHRTRLLTARDAANLAGQSFDLAVNATSLGLRPEDPLPLDPGGQGPKIRCALDLVYSPQGTRWVDVMASAGIPAADGLEMLLQQGAAAFERWWRLPAPLSAMRAALPPR
jgi:shikimate dehydrogenase